MPWNDKLVSVILLSYNNADCLPRALTSVFSQDYPHIEIIITDDGSEDFSENEIYEYIETHKTSNIERYSIITSPVNTGTVCNLRRALKEIHGDYYLNFGADDTFYDSNVISAYIHTFYLRNWDPLVITGKTGMYSKDLKHFQRGLPNRKGIEVLLEEDPKATLNMLASSCVVVNVSSCFRKDFPELVDAYDTRYILYEDYPTFIRMARKGYTPVFINRYCVKHASGGVANGTDNLQLSKTLFEDRNMMWKTEFDPYRNLYTQQSLAANSKRRKYEYKVYKMALLNEAAKQKTVKGVIARGLSYLRRLTGKLAKRDQHVSKYLQIAALFSVSFFSLRINENTFSGLLPTVIRGVFGFISIVILILCGAILLCKHFQAK